MRENIDHFLAPKRFAMAGVSTRPKHGSRSIYNELRGIGYDILPLNPKGGEIDGQKVYTSVKELPEGTDRLLIFTHKRSSQELVEEALAAGIKSIWIQQGSATPGAIEAAQRGGAKLVHKCCIMMYAEPVKSIHKFHRALARIFGGYKK